MIIVIIRIVNFEKAKLFDASKVVNLKVIKPLIATNRILHLANTIFKLYSYGKILSGLENLISAKTRPANIT